MIKLCAHSKKFIFKIQFFIFKCQKIELNLLLIDKTIILANISCKTAFILSNECL